MVCFRGKIAYIETAMKDKQLWESEKYKILLIFNILPVFNRGTAT